MSDLPGRLVDVRGTRLHVTEHGDPSAPAVVFLHGGPGQGAYDFVHHQGERLGRDLRLVALDQRGSLFSDPLGPDEQVSESMLVDDIESLRQQLGIERWVVLGHSFGGRLAVRYAAAHPGHTAALVLENPTLDWVLSSSCLLTAALDVLDDLQAPEAAEVRAVLATGVTPDVGSVRRHGRLMDALGERRPEIYFHQPAILADLGAALPSQLLAPDVRDRGDRPGEQLREHAGMQESLLPRLAELRMDALLMCGLYDHVCDDDHIEVWGSTVPDGEMAWFEESGHFCHIEEPDTYARTLVEFVRAYS